MTIVLADDDEDDRVLAQEALEAAGVDAELQTVNDGAALLDRLRRPAGEADARPDLVLLDLNMPRMNGHEALAEIKQDPALRSIPVVVFTTSKNPDNVATTYDLGGNSYITKPSTFPDLVEVLTSFWRYWAETVSLPAAQPAR